jgi:hypothetical protein
LDLEHVADRDFGHEICAVWARATDANSPQLAAMNKTFFMMALLRITALRAQPINLGRPF